MAQVIAVFKAIVEFLGLAKFFVKLFKKTETEKTIELENDVEKEKEKVKHDGRPT